MREALHFRDTTQADIDFVLAAERHPDNARLSAPRALSSIAPGCPTPTRGTCWSATPAKRQSVF
jgi:hypothetical protein